MELHQVEPHYQQALEDSQDRQVSQCPADLQAEQDLFEASFCNK